MARALQRELAWYLMNSSVRSCVSATSLVSASGGKLSSCSSCGLTWTTRTPKRLDSSCREWVESVWCDSTCTRAETMHTSGGSRRTPHDLRWLPTTHLHAAKGLGERDLLRA